MLKNDEKSSSTTKSATSSSSTEMTRSSKPTHNKDLGKGKSENSKTNSKPPMTKGCFIYRNKGHWAKECVERQRFSLM